MKKGIIVLIAFIAAFSGSVKADEGMWLPALVQKLNIDKMHAMGCELTADQIYSVNHSSLKDAVVALDHGSCTGELISPDGLLLTNHHCGFDEIQAHSTVDHDYLKDGFWAKSRDQELPNPGKTVSFLISITDVTAKIDSALTPDMDENARETKVEGVASKLEKAASDGTDYQARVRSFFESNKYYLFVYETFRDIRLVGAPPQSIGKFGGDTDNWQWPRQTGDFSMFRVYCSPDGKPADYSPENVPFHPKHFLPISLKGVHKGDFAMIMGYPGRTERYKSSYGVEFAMDVTNEVRMKVRSQKLAIIKKYMETGPKARLQYASKYARSANYYKYSIGQNKGLKALDVIGDKKALEKRFTNWVDEDTAREAKYGKALSLIKEAYQNTDDEVAGAYMREVFLRGPEIFRLAMRANGLYEVMKSQPENKDAIRAMSARIQGSLDEFFKDYNASTDEKLVAALSKIYADNVDPKYYPAYINTIRDKYRGDYSKFAEKMFKKTIFSNEESLKAFLNDPSLKVLKKDPAFQATEQIIDAMRVINSDNMTTVPELEKGRRLFVAGLMEMDKGQKLYPDANSTMRLTYGTVGGYSPRDGVWYKYFTTLAGYIQKDIPGDDEFDTPQRLKDLYYAKDYGQYADKDGTLHTCFLTNNDITGGNSGSPVINAKGELIGAAFDGNWEAMSGDIAFEPKIQRTICVDIRFVLWVIDKYAGATNLIDEMTIVR